MKKKQISVVLAATTTAYTMFGQVAYSENLQQNQETNKTNDIKTKDSKIEKINDKDSIKENNVEKEAHTAVSKNEIVNKEHTDNDKVKPKTSKDIKNGIPSFSSNMSLNNSSITVINQWNGPSVVIKFNPLTKKIEVSGDEGYIFGPGSNQNLKLTVFNPKNGKIIESSSFNGSSYMQGISNDFNGKEFNYGDVVTLQYAANSGSVRVLNGKNNIGNSTGTTETFSITANGFVKSSLKSIKINPFDILRQGKVQEGTLTGQAESNSEVNVLVNGKDFTGTTNSEGEFSIKLTDSEGFTKNTEILVSAVNRMVEEIKPTINSSIKIQNSEFQIINQWGINAGVIRFNPLNMTLDYDFSNPETYLGCNGEKFMTVKVYNQESNSYIVDKSFNGNNSSADLAKEINGKTFTYGDIIEISYNSAQGSISLLDGENSNSNISNEYFKISKGGLVKITSNAKINPFNILTGYKVTKGNITGNAEPNTKITVEVEGKTFNGVTNSKGEFNIQIKDSNGFTGNTNVKVKMQAQIGAVQKNIKPGLSPRVKINNSSLTIINNWNGPSVVIKFNPATNKIEVTGDQGYIFGNLSNQYFKINVFNPKSGKIIADSSFNGSSYMQAITELLNGKNFSYGDIVTVQYSANPGNIEVLNGKTDLGNATGKSESFEITENGFVKSNLKAVKVNPFDVLGNGATKVTEGTLTGVANPNVKVNVLVNGKEFVGETDSKGNFSIDIADKDGFTLNTNVTVSTIDRKITVINPTINVNTKIQNFKFKITNQWRTNVAEIGFNPVNMSFNFNSSNLSNFLGFNGNKFMTLRVYNPVTNENIINQSFNGNNSAADLENAIKGKKFEYGDIFKISYDTNQGTISLLNGNETIANINDQFFKITKTGLVKESPKVSVNPFKVLTGYKVTSGDITGAGEPNTIVTVKFNGRVVSGKVNAKGMFNIPIEDQSGFTQDTNIQVEMQSQVGLINEIVKPSLSTAVKINNSSLTIINNWNGPSVVIKFNPLTNKIEVTGDQGYIFGNSSNQYFKISIFNPKNGQIIANSRFNGSSYMQAITQLLNGKNFNYGDIVTVQYSANPGNMEVLNGKTNLGNTTGKSESFEITEDGLIKSTIKAIKVNAFDVLGNGTTKVTEGVLTGKANPNTKVNVSVNGKEFIGETDAKGNFSIDITDKNGFTLDTNIIVSAIDRRITEINPTININTKIQNFKFQINNQWGIPAAELGFNPMNMNFEFNSSNLKTFLGFNGNKFMTLRIYNPLTNVNIVNQSFNGNSTSIDLENAIKEKKFEYGDIIKISYDTNQGTISLLDGNKTISNINNQFFKITKVGLVEEKPNVSVNPFKVLTGYKVTSGDITGAGEPNTIVTINVDGKILTGKVNSEGVFNIPIEDSNGFTQDTNIQVVIPSKVGLIKEIVKPSLSTAVKLNDSNITIINDWSGPSVVMKFNPLTKEIEVSGDEGYIFGTGNNEFFKITIMNPENGNIIANQSFAGSDYMQGLTKLLNGKSFNYGDVVTIQYSADPGSVEILNGKTNLGNITGESETFEITESGFVQSALKSIKVNSFDVLGTSNAAVTEGTLTGITLKPDRKVFVSIGKNKFTGISNSKGQFAINVADKNGFTNNTKITVFTKGELVKIIYPTASSNLGILKDKFQLANNEYGIAQTISLDPATMKINNQGNGVAVQLLNQNTGQVKASLAGSNFNAFTSNNNLNGSSFKYGDVISFYESEETYLSDQYLMLEKGKQTTNINDVNQFKSYIITPNGVIPVGNKNLKDVKALYEGSATINVSGKTLPNTELKLFYGNGIEETVESNAKGEFSSEIPLNEAGMGSEVRVYLNNENVQSVLVGYNSSEFNSDNSIQLINNEAVPVINITFNMAKNIVKSMIYPQTKTYAGTFYGNKLDISFIDPKTGKVIKSVISEKQGEIAQYSNELNGIKYNNGEIIRIQFNNNFVSANVIENKKQIGNTTGISEYFEITNKGLVNVTNKFITVKPLDILDGSKIMKTNVEGKVNPNEKVSILVNNKVFTGLSNSKGDFKINVEDLNGFTKNTEVTVSANGYVPTVIKPTINGNYHLDTSYINIYQRNASWLASSLYLGIGFNVINKTFYVNNYKPIYNVPLDDDFKFYLYNNYGKEIYNSKVSSDSTKEFYKYLNGKSFEYGDIIGLSFNPSVYKPVVLNENNSIGNINGKMEYFKITKEGLKRIDFGMKSNADKVCWNNGNLQISANLAQGNSESFIKSNKSLVIINSSNQIIASEKTTKAIKNGKNIITGEFSKDDLSKLIENEKYTIGLEGNGKIIPLYINCETPSSNEYILSGNSKNELTINLKEKAYVNIVNTNDLKNYLNIVNQNLDSTGIQNKITDLSTNEKAQNEVFAALFIKRVGLKNLEIFYNESTQNAKFINWVLNNSVAMEEFLSGPNPNGPHVPEGQQPATYTECLQVWSNIWSTYTNSHYGFNLKLAIAVGLTNGKEISSFPAGVPVGSPVERYNIFETLNATGQMFPFFSKLDVSHLCYIVNTDLCNDQILKARSIILQNHNELITENLLTDVAYTINYNGLNPHTGVSVFNNNFYGPNPTIKTVWYDGGVCGATARLGAAGEQIFGIPAVQTPQPGHNAFIYYDASVNKWYVGNDVFGWSQTYDADMSSWSNALTNSWTVASYTLLYQKADNSKLKESNIYMYLSEFQNGYSEKVQDLQKAIEIQPLNLGAWTKLVKLYKTNPNISLSEYNSLVEKIVNLFNNYPMPMYDLLLQFKNVYKYRGTQQEFNNYINNITNGLNESGNKKIADYLLTQMKKDGLTPENYVEGRVDAINNYQINLTNPSNVLMGTIAFNAESKKIDLIEGNGLTGGPSNETNFTVSLENKDGKVIKSVSVDFNNWPEAKMYNALNNLSFNYGDKLVIKQNTNLTKFTVNKLFKQNGEELKQYDLINPITTIYINKNGLSLAKNSMNFRGNVNIAIENQNGDKLEKNIAYQGPMYNGLDIENNINIPKGYELEKAICNGKVIYVGNSIENAIYNINQLQYQYKNQNFTLIVKVNKTKLENEIKIAQKKIVTEGVPGYTEASKAILNSTIVAGEKVNENINSTVREVENATENIVNAIKELEVAVPQESKTELENQITGTQKVLAEGTENGNEGYTEGTTSNVENAINNAKNILANPNVTPNEIKKASEDLTNALNGLKVNKAGLENTIKTAQNKIATEGTPGYTESSKAALNNAITAGEKVNQNTDSTLGEVKTATNNIETAMKNLQVGASQATKTGLENQIAGVQKVLTEGTSNGNLGYTKETTSKVENAIDNAKTVLANSNVTPNEIKKASEELTNALNGLKVNKAGLESEIKTAQNKIATEGTPGYTEASKAALNNAITAGEKVNQNADSTLGEVKTATNNIETAMKNLQVAASQATKTGLENQIVGVQKVLTEGTANGNEGYTEGSTSNVENAIKNAKTILANPNVTPNEIKKASEELTNALDGLKVNKAGLENEIKTAQNKIATEGTPGYTESSKAALNNAITAGEKVDKNVNSTLGEVKTATNNIETAMKNLQMAASQATKTSLENQIAGVQKVLTEGTSNGNLGYTKATTSNVGNAINNAKNILANPNVTPNEIKKASEELTSALNGLKVNKAGLENEIKTAQNKIATEGTPGYTESSKAALNNAIAAGEKVAKDIDATVNDVKIATENIANGIKELEVNVVKPKVKINSDKKNEIKNTTDKKQDNKKENTVDKKQDNKTEKTTDKKQQDNKKENTKKIETATGSAMIRLVNSDNKPLVDTEVTISGIQFANNLGYVVDNSKVESELSTIHVKTNANGDILLSNLTDKIQNITLEIKGYENNKLEINPEAGKLGDYTVKFKKVQAPIVKTGTMKIEIVNANGDIISKTNVEGQVGQEVIMPLLPKTDKIVSISENGKTIKELPKTIEDGNNTIVIKIEPSVTPAKKDNNKEKADNTKDNVKGNTNKDNSKEDSNNNPKEESNTKSNPKEVTNNTDNSTNSKNSSKEQTNNNPEINHKESANKTDSNSKGQADNKSQEITNHEKTNNNEPTVKNDNNKEQSNTKEVKKSVDNKTEDNTNKTDVKAKEINSVSSNKDVKNTSENHTSNKENNKGSMKIKVETDKSDTISSSSIEGTVGTKINKIEAPNGYKIVSITENGNIIKEIPQNISNGENNVVVKVEKTSGYLPKVDLSHSPKTGDSSEMPYFLGLLAALGILGGLKRKRKKLNKETN